MHADAICVSGLSRVALNMLLPTSYEQTKRDRLKRTVGRNTVTVKIKSEKSNKDKENTKHMRLS